MDETQLAILARLPLAEGVGWLYRHTLDDAMLDHVWEHCRGRCYTRAIQFPDFVRLIHDALVTYGSGRESFEKHRAASTLQASVTAAFGKLRRVPVAVSEQLLRQGTSRLRQLFPDWSCWQKPHSLQKFRIAVYDGKAVKRVAKRLKPTRGTTGGLLGGRALVVVDWETGLAIGMRGDPDGEANEVKYVGELVPYVHEELEGPILHVSDRGFCDLEQPRHFLHSPEDHFLVRYHPKVKFHRDSQRAERRSVNEEGQTVMETWGWLGNEKDRRRLYVRRIELIRDGADSVILITSLIDPDEFPATDLLWIYRERWEIERLFQKVTEVFGLSHLIGCGPLATLFQFAFCMLLYNMIQVVRGYIAQAQNCEPSDVSSEMLFRDVERQVSAWHLLFTVEQTVAFFEPLPSPKKLTARLNRLFGKTWCDTWLASPPQEVHRRSPRRRTRTHASVHRLLYGSPSKKRRQTRRPRCLQQ
jgi:hypothetical protein